MNAVSSTTANSLLGSCSILPVGSYQRSLAHEPSEFGSDSYMNRMFEMVELPQVQVVTMNDGRVGHIVPLDSRSHSAFIPVMRTFGYIKREHGGKQESGWKRTELYSKREATEWDVRLDVNEVLTAEVIINNIKERLDELCYVLVSGVELPDNVSGGCLDPARGSGTTGTKSPTTSTEHHVHLCVVLFRPLKRGDVLQLVRGTRKMGDEYCAPRNPRFTCAGWVIHHGKPGFKIEGEPLIRFEWGTLPMDPFTEDTASKIKSLLNKWGTPDMKERFKGYTDLITKESIKRKIEQLQMQLEDH